jgi:hypothetical protein
LIAVWAAGPKSKRSVENIGNIWQDQWLNMKPSHDEQTAHQIDPPAASPEVGPRSQATPQPPVLPREIGGRDGPEPTRFGDWEKAGRCIDF